MGVSSMGHAGVKAVQRFGVVVAAATLVAGIGHPADAQGARNMIDSVTAADGLRIVYETSGEGTPALVFVHGWSCDRTYWKGQIEPFSRRFKVVGVDLGGHGESGRGGRVVWSMAAFGGDVAAVVESLDLERVVLIGHSMGGDVIVEAARRLPERVAALVWIDTYTQLRTPRTPEQLQALVAPFRTNFVEATRAFVRGMFPVNADRTLVEQVAADMSAAPPAVALGSLESAMSFDREIPRALQELKLPVVTINPDNRPSDVASLERYGVEVVFMTGVGHFPMLEDPERFNRILGEVLDKLVH